MLTAIALAALTLARKRLRTKVRVTILNPGRPDLHTAKRVTIRKIG